MPPPALGKQPGSGLRDRREHRRSVRNLLFETVEPACRCARVETTVRIPVATVVAPIAQDVDQREPCLLRGPEDSRVVSVGPNPARAVVGTIERPRHSDGEASDRARQRHAIASFAEQMQVIGLDAEMDDPAPEALAARGNCCG